MKIIETADGSHSLLHESLNETYHSVYGAMRESVHVFIENGLNYFIKKNQSTKVAILEIGFGTGLNALLSLQEAITQKIKIDYTSVEAFPVDEKIIDQLNYAKRLAWADAYKCFTLLHSSSWNLPVSITENFILEKIQEDIEVMTFADSRFDIIFFDAFAPAKQPEMWQLPILQKVIKSLTPSGVFVTYCAQGQLKRNLKSLGMVVETLPGPPGKREMVRAFF